MTVMRGKSVVKNFPHSWPLVLNSISPDIVELVAVVVAFTDGENCEKKPSAVENTVCLR